MGSDRKLIIISDTPMWRDSSETPCVYEPTLREIEQVAALFDEVIWLGFNRPDYVFGNGRASMNSKIRFKLLWASGGHSLFSALRSILLLPYYNIVILWYLWGAKNVHTRGPSVPALIAVLLSFVFRGKTYWHKYAGNWGADQAPFFYRLQKKLVLKATFSNITINGHWNDQLPHVFSFDNPCLTAEELKQASQMGRGRSFDPPFIFCFVGRLEEAKGVGNLLQAFSLVASLNKIDSLQLAGDGAMRKQYEEVAQKSLCKINFLGGLDRTRLNEVYAKSHFLVLPSRSEGFPKVLSEAAAFGCIPVVTNVSALAQYIRPGVNGFFLENNKPETIQKIIDFIISGEFNLGEISKAASSLANNFTYEKFVERLRKEVFRK